MISRSPTNNTCRGGTPVIVASYLSRTAQRHFRTIPTAWPWANTVITADHRLTALTT